MHRVRRNRILAIFAVVFLIFGIQLIMVHVQTNKINAQAVTTNKQLTKLKKSNKNLEEQATNLRDPDYLSKMIRYKFYYSKPGETIYNIPETAGDNN